MNGKMAVVQNDMKITFWLPVDLTLFDIDELVKYLKEQGFNGNAVVREATPEDGESCDFVSSREIPF